MSNYNILDEIGVSEVLSGESQSTQDPKATWRQLTLSVCYSPGDLKLHSQRILFCLDNNLIEYISGALHDLFIALDNKGKALRLRMFNLASPIMSLNDRAYFQRWLSENTDKDIKCCEFNGSALDNNTCIQQEQSNIFDSIPDFKTPSEEVEYLIESGKLLEAQIFLEKVYAANTKNKTLQKELQRFYFYTKNKESMNKFIVTLRDSGVKIAKSWIGLQELSKTW